MKVYGHRKYSGLYPENTLTMKYINYRELYPKWDYPFMRDNLASSRYPHQDFIINYLLGGEVVLTQFSRNRDVFSGALIDVEIAILTDGDYYWSNQLAYYVDKYNLKLPEAFVKHILK